MWRTWRDRALAPELKTTPFRPFSHGANVQGRSVFHNAQELQEFSGAVAEIAEGDGNLLAAGQTQQTNRRIAKGR